MERKIIKDRHQL